ncbi:hypothetical protein FYK55_14805 [Roseiconus nitratireducens]|uniref:SLA1 homology domain-containing protein n=1 Tax=Roseiconus nitratireducens TaxID=2605748 RepID=A0A5M6D3J7_9BACT|nr:SHD1 domain-containing protein [Roseiconus nitratireducens]KAA5542077.1 hypothetical protein FYK55_14805 [Roseiconus nitratireducens]
MLINAAKRIGLICLCVPFWIAGAWAANVGDQVEFSRAGTKLQGRVVEIRPGGRFLLVETEIGGSLQKVVVVASRATVMTGSASEPSGAQSRMWSDQSGRFQIEASLVSQTATTVRLRKADGRVVDVPVDKLSLKDQEYLATVDTAEENPFAGGTFSPGPAGAGGGPAAMNSTASGGASSRGGLNLGQATSYSVTQPLVFQRMDAAKQVSADPSPYQLSSLDNVLLQTGEVPFGSDLHRPVIVADDGSRAAYCLINTRSDEKGTQLFLADLSSRRSKQVGFLPEKVWLSTAEPQSGDILGIVSGIDDHRPSSLCVISGMSQGNPNVIAHWRMFPNDDKKQDYVRYRKILPGKLAVTVYDGQVHVHDYGSGRERWRAKTESFNEPTISPGGQYIAMMAEDQCVILRTADGQQLGSVPFQRGAGSLGFSPDGTKLAVAMGTSLSIFDVATGEETLTHEANVGLAVLGKNIMWAGDDFLLLPSGVLFSIPSNLIIWKYNLSGDALEYTDLIHQGLLTFAERGYVGIVRVPHDAAKAEAGKNHSGLTALESGDTISVQVKSGAPGISPNDITGWLTEAAKSSGYQVAGNAPTRLEVSITRGETKQRTYRNIGAFGSETVSFTPYTSKIQLVQGGKTLWQQSRTTSMPFFISGSKSLQETAREYEKPREDFFKQVSIPKQILKPEYQSGFGTSLVNGQGIR